MEVLTCLNTNNTIPGTTLPTHLFVKRTLEPDESWVSETFTGESCASKEEITFEMISTINCSGQYYGKVVPYSPETQAYIASCISTYPEYKKEDVIRAESCRILNEIWTFSSTPEDLSGTNFQQLNTEFTSLLQIGVAMDHMLGFKELVKENDTKEMDIDVYKTTFNDLVSKELNSLIDHCKIVQEHRCFVSWEICSPKLKDASMLPDDIIDQFKKIDKEKVNIQRIIDELKLYDMPGIAWFMRHLYRMELLSDILLSKGKKVTEQCEELWIAKKAQFERICVAVIYLEKLAQDYAAIRDSATFGLNGLDSIIQSIIFPSPFQHGSKIKVKKANVESKPKICRMEHNTPFCGNCGWQNSWIKSFNKRGVHIQVVNKKKNKNIWHNDIKDR